MTRTQLNEFTFYSRLSSPLFFIIIIILNKLFWPFICIQRFWGNSVLYKVHRGFWLVPFLSDVIFCVQRLFMQPYLLSNSSCQTEAK